MSHVISRCVYCDYRYFSDIASSFLRRADADIGNDFDLLIVDGPPESTGEFARFPALPVLEKRLAESCTVLLDDVHRPNEAQILQDWQQAFPEFVELQSGLTRTGVIKRCSNCAEA